MRAIDFGLTSWAEIDARQAVAVAEVQAGGEARVLYGEHPPTLSLGRRSPPLPPEEILRLTARGLVVTRADRGGATTIFAPGQAIVYPIVRLRHGVVAHTTALAAAAQRVVARLGDGGLDVRFDRAHPGLWVGPRKLASLGLRVQRRVTSHGLALCVAPDLDLFSLVEICATPGLRMTSLAAEGVQPLPPAGEVARAIAEELAHAAVA